MTTESIVMAGVFLKLDTTKAIWQLLVNVLKGAFHVFHLLTVINVPRTIAFLQEVVF